MSKRVVCFGEMLWDCFPTHEIPGGAPMNVALHLSQLGLDVALISRLGKDTYGEGLKKFVSQYSLDQKMIQLDEEHATGTVVVNDDDPQNVKYTIVYPVAWDFIDWSESIQAEVNGSDAFIFGSLAVRNEQSWETLYQLIHSPVLKVFDINLRAPYIDFEQIEIILGYTDILKINEDELAMMATYFGIELDSNEVLPTAKKVCDFLVEEFPIELICVTLGSKGAMIYQNGKVFRHAGYQVKVADTVGSGDAFLSGFVKSYLDGREPMEILDFACALGAYVATQKGGTPRYSLDDVDAVRRAL
ncbi:carbohydrate kinase family protein [Mongoliitalea daihaiensis]|uniref:carbohydrate kinase family protein n=1 Tax=Mongoliitalea daihaiensis TaxID=2782006 RepID=UPI001F1F5F24|nr:carbohydrate kinase [Mongoliitalea daihaiensis]UJP63716.1 carbohydrate kinase [Mongoliitalea daihaiensis]